MAFKKQAGSKKLDMLLNPLSTTGQSWSFTNDDGSKTTVTERIIELWNSNNR